MVEIYLFYNACFAINCNFCCFSIAPSSPRNVTVVNETSTTLLVTWLTPSIPNGVVINYQVNYTGFTSVNLVPTSFFQPQFITIPANETSVVLLDLVPYSKYTIVVRAYTSAGPGEPSEEIEDRTEEDGEHAI